MEKTSYVFVAKLEGETPEQRLWFKDFGKARAYSITYDNNTTISFFLPKVFEKKSEKGQYYIALPDTFKVKVSKYNHDTKESKEKELSAKQLSWFIKEIRDHIKIAKMVG